MRTAKVLGPGSFDYVVFVFLFLLDASVFCVAFSPTRIKSSFPRLLPTSALLLLHVCGKIVQSFSWQLTDMERAGQIEVLLGKDGRKEAESANQEVHALLLVEALTVMYL